MTTLFWGAGATLHVVRNTVRPHGVATNIDWHRNAAVTLPDTTVAADACYVAKHATGRSKVVLAETLNPQVRQVVKTYAPGFGLEVVEYVSPDDVVAVKAV